MIRGTGIVAYLVLAWLVLAPSQAQASCGDYVMVGGQNDSSHLGNLGAGDLHTNHHSQTPVCHGPSCSNGAIPPSAPVPRVEVTLEQWGLLGHSTLSRSTEPKFLLAAAEALLCAGFEMSILRPPR